MKAPKNVEHKLSEAIAGNNGEVFLLDLVAPQKKFIKKTYKLQQLFTRMQFSASKLYSSIAREDEAEKDEKEDEKEDKISFEPDQVWQMLLASDVDIEDVFVEFEKLVRAGAVLADGEKININQWNQIIDEDQEGLVANYLANFIGALAMKSFQTS